MNDAVNGKRNRSNDTGRTQLKGVLDGLVQQSKEEREIHDSATSVDGDVEEGARDLLQLPHLRGELNRKRGRSTPPRAKKKKLQQIQKDLIPSSEGSESSDTDGSRHIPYVMTLFDRKVDLARFTEGTSLYVMCREWMRNNPDPIEENLTNGVQDKSSPNVNIIQHDQFNSGIYRLPSPLPCVEQQSLNAATSLQASEDMFPPLELEENMEALRSNHIKKWKDTRARWKLASLVNQQRYAKSLKIICELYERKGLT